LIFSSLALALISVTTAILTAIGKPMWTFALTGPLLPLTLAGHLVLIPCLGAFGAALVTMLGAVFGALAAVFAVHHIWRIIPPFGTFCRSALIGGMAYGLAVIWPTSGGVLWVKLSLLSLMIGLIFLLIGEFSPSEIRQIRIMLGWQTVSEGES
jgi:O-antigen/teichoic acid export membrane protein